MGPVTVHHLNENLVVSLHELPGFRKMGSVVVNDENGIESGSVAVYFTGDYFNQVLPVGDFYKTRGQVTKLVRNHAIKNDYGVSTGRLNLTISLRERNNARIPITTDI